jgi:hypothetical protein
MFGIHLYIYPILTVFALLYEENVHAITQSIHLISDNTFNLKYFRSNYVYQIMPRLTATT